MGGPVVTRPEQKPLFYPRISTRLPERPIGKDLDCICIGDDGRIYYCKDDAPPRMVRATEWVGTKLAEHLGVAVAECSVLEDFNGQTFFGSRQPLSLADEFTLNRILQQAHSDEVGRPAKWLGAYLAKVWAYDIFIDNPDRTLKNFVLDREGSMGKIKAIDFASARLFQISSGNFPIASENTSTVGRFIRATHGAHQESAYEMLDRIGAVRPAVIEDILGAMPPGWMQKDQMVKFFEVWSSGKHKDRVERAKALIAHDWGV